MPLRGQAKIEYQRDYMRKRRQGLTDIEKEALDPIHNPSQFLKPDPKPVRPPPSPLPNCPDGGFRPIDADGNPIYED